MKILLDGSLRTDLVDMTLLLKAPALARTLKMRLAEILRIPETRLRISAIEDIENGIFDWQQIPSAVLVSDKKTFEINKKGLLMVTMPNSQVFYVEFDKTSTKQAVKLAVAKIIGFPEGTFVLVDPDNIEWDYANAKSTDFDAKSHNAD